jgi:hypothetical protein
MALHFETPQAAAQQWPQVPEIDTSKRYDIFCSDLPGRSVVYRNALFKSVVRLTLGYPRDVLDQYIGIEQSNGQIVFVSKRCILKFCDAGTQLVEEHVPTK